MNKFYKNLITTIVASAVPELINQVGEGVREYLKDKREIKQKEEKQDEVETSIKEEKAT